MDTFNRNVRSSIMTAVKSTHNQSTERKVRSSLASRGIKNWKMHFAELPGKPDFVFPARKLAVFVDGCFWHGCPRCYRRPKTSRAYWDRKVIRNSQRDRRNFAVIRRKGWRVIRIWEHQLVDDNWFANCLAPQLCPSPTWQSSTHKAPSRRRSSRT